MLIVVALVASVSASIDAYQSNSFFEAHSAGTRDVTQAHLEAVLRAAGMSPVS